MGMQSYKLIDVKDILNALWRGKFFIFFVVFMCSSVAVYWSLSLPNLYRAELKMIPSENQSQDSGQLSGLASLAGINLNKNSSKSGLALEVIKTKQFLAKFIEEKELREVLMASQSWDNKSGELAFNDLIYSVELEKWVRQPQGLKRVTPSYIEAATFFLANNLKILTDDAGVTHIYVTHFSPVIAATIANDLVGFLNSEIQEQTISESEEAISYLEIQLKNTTNSMLQNTLYRLMETELRTIMLAKSKDGYAFKVIDEAFIPEEKSSPRRAIICALAFIASLILSSVGIVIYFVFRNKNL